MAQCRDCSTTLSGSWNMTSADASYEATGRYLGVNGYFLYGESSNWVYCYCKPCWEKRIMTLSFVSSALNTLQQQNASLQQQLVASQAESASYKAQLHEMSEKFQKLTNNSEIEKIRDLFKKLTTSQIGALHTHTSFRVDSFEIVHAEQQVQCSSQFAQSNLRQLRSSIDAVIQLQNNTLAQLKQAKESIIQALTPANASKALVDATTKPIETEIEQIEASIVGWNTFSATLVQVLNESNSTNEECEAKSTPVDKV